MKKTGVAIDEIYRERERFIIVGLTGRTGSGCTTTAGILETDTFDKLTLQQPKETGFLNCDERKYRIVYRYAEKHWSPFFIIKMSDIIASFVFQHGFEKMNEHMENKGAKLAGNGDLASVLEKELIDKINSLSVAINQQLVEGSNSLSRDSVNYGKEQLELLKNISETSQQLKMAMRNVQCECNDESGKVQIADSYTYFFQTYGNNIRSSGNPFDSSFSGKHMFDVARRTNDFIKAIRKATPNVDHRICIDTIRNPYEATYFKDRYAAFYLVSVNCEERDRKYRLSHLPKEAIDSLDAIEHPSSLKGNSAFFEQNIAACLELTDIHLYNPQRQIHEKYLLTEQIIRYVMLILHPGLITPTHMERCMQTAYNAKVNSGCLSRQVGAVITDENYSVKAIGWNDVPQGQIPCSLRDVRAYCINKDKDSHSQYEIEDTDFSNHVKQQNMRIDYDKLNGRLHPYCFKDYFNEIKGTKNQVHTRALHAEENAFLQIAKYGGAGIKGGYLFATASPCELCSKKAYQLGITKIFYIDPYPGISANHILTFGYNNPHNPEMILFYGAIGHAYTMLYSQRIPLKDELEKIL